MANPHFAKLGDVWKHLPLVEALRREPPAAYCETHAGAAWYPLTPSPERRYGIYAFLERAPGVPALASSRYLHRLRRLPTDAGAPQRYPGSATLAMMELGRGAEYVLADTDAASVDDLRGAAAALGLADRARCVEGDGMPSVQAFCEAHASPASVLVHVDPFDPHGVSRAGGVSAIELAARLAERSVRVAYWYGLDHEDHSGWAWRELGGAAPGWSGELAFPARFVYAGRDGMWGCGVVLLNLAGATCEAIAAQGRALAGALRGLPEPGEPPVRFAERGRGA